MGIRANRHNVTASLFAALAVISFMAAPVLAQPTPPLEPALHHPNAGRGGMVVAEEKLAAQIGAEILRKGGNAVDAAVATGFALAVTYPRAGNIGGGGFMLVHIAETGETVAIDYRETAPAAASRDMYLDADGNVDTQRRMAFTQSRRRSPVLSPGCFMLMKNMVCCRAEQ